jgi:hypothetical protein
MTSVFEFGGGRPNSGDEAGSGESGTEAVGREVCPAPVLLVSLYDPVEAEIVVAKLRSAGIDTFVQHEALSVVYGLTVDGAGQQDIFVRPDELAEARVALEQTP